MCHSRIKLSVLQEAHERLGLIDKECEQERSAVADTDSHYICGCVGAIVSLIN